MVMIRGLFMNSFTTLPKNHISGFHKPSLTPSPSPFGMCFNGESHISWEKKHVPNHQPVWFYEFRGIQLTPNHKKYRPFHAFPNLHPESFWGIHRARHRASPLWPFFWCKRMVFLRFFSTTCDDIKMIEEFALEPRAPKSFGALSHEDVDHVPGNLGFSTPAETFHLGYQQCETLEVRTIPHNCGRTVTYEVELHLQIHGEKVQEWYSNYTLNWYTTCCPLQLLGVGSSCFALHTIPIQLASGWNREDPVASPSRDR